MLTVNKSFVLSILVIRPRRIGNIENIRRMLQWKVTAQQRRVWREDQPQDGNWYVFALFFVLLIGVGILYKCSSAGRVREDNGERSGKPSSTAHTKLIENPTVLPVWKWFTAPVKVLFSSDEPLVVFVIFLSVMVGGIYYVLDKADVLKRMIAWIYRKFGKQKYFILFFMTSLFLIVGSTIGFGGNHHRHHSADSPVSALFGWDSLVGVALIWLQRAVMPPRPSTPTARQWCRALRAFRYIPDCGSGSFTLL